MKEFHGRASTNVDAEPRGVLEFITDVDRLPEWNAAIEAVVKQPTVLHPGEEWIVKMHPPHVPSWKSVSRVEELRALADGAPTFFNLDVVDDRSG